MTPSQISKRQERLTVNIQRVIDVRGVGHAFLATFTTQANLSMDQFQSTWNSFVTDVLVRRLGTVGDDWKLHFHGVGVIEPQERGAPHMHLAGTVEDDIGTGVRWVERCWKGKRGWLIARQSKPASLVRLQEFLMRSWDAHVRSKTGQTEKKICNAHCMPVRTSALAAARYLAGYLEKGESRPGEWKGRKLYREYGASRSKTASGEVVVNSPHPCRGSFTRYAVETKAGYRVRVHGLLWRARVAAFAAEFGCSSLPELVSHLGKTVLFDQRELIRGMVLPESFPYPSDKSRLYESNLRKSRELSNRKVIEAGGLRVVAYRPVLLVHAFSTTLDERFWSGVPGSSCGGESGRSRSGELFPERVVVISPVEASIRAAALSRRGRFRGG
ncbi:MAG: hypothetical protein LV481_11495 [Methylacidiphilales bacterium]|nr:hypothetical protein [Candidatus Methylacidiphilales bacterium]